MCGAIDDIYRSEGQGPAWAKFAAVCGFEAPADGARHEPAGLEPPSAQESANGEGMLAHCLRLTTRYRPGLSALRAAAVGGVGRSASPPHRGRARQAARTPLVEFPGENGGFAGEPEPFAQTLRSALTGAD